MNQTLELEDRVDMADEAPKEKSSKQKKKQLTEQLEERWVGSRTEVFSRILAKESEIRTKTQEERKKADRRVEDAKGKAGEIKRKATLEEVGRDLYEAEMAKARKEAEKIEASVGTEAEKIKEDGIKNLEKAVDLIVKSVIPEGV